MYCEMGLAIQSAYTAQYIMYWSEWDRERELASMVHACAPDTGMNFVATKISPCASIHFFRSPWSDRIIFLLFVHCDFEPSAEFRTIEPVGSFSLVFVARNLLFYRFAIINELVCPRKTSEKNEKSIEHKHFSCNVIEPPVLFHLAELRWHKST